MLYISYNELQIYQISDRSEGDLSNKIINFKFPFEWKDIIKKLPTIADISTMSKVHSFQTIKDIYLNF